MTPPVVLTIAGSDPTAGAGIQADLKTFAAHGGYGVCVLTAVTVQNSRGVSAVHPLPAELVTAQLFAVLEDLPVAAVKVGMLATAEIAEAIATVGYALPNLVLDPVLVSSSGHRLTATDAVRRLLPFATVVTPNADEAPYVTDAPQWTIVTGGDGAVDTISGPDGTWELAGEPVGTRNTHGTGCTFSAAIAAGLAKGRDPLAAITRAKQYVSRAIETSLAIGHGHGPTNHLVDVTTEW